MDEVSKSILSVFDLDIFFLLPPPQELNLACLQIQNFLQSCVRCKIRYAFICPFVMIIIFMVKEVLLFQQIADCDAFAQVMQKSFRQSTIKQFSRLLENIQLQKFEIPLSLYVTYLKDSLRLFILRLPYELTALIIIRLLNSLPA